MPRIKKLGGRRGFFLASLFAVGLVACDGDLRRGSPCYAWADSVCSYQEACSVEGARAVAPKGECMAAETSRCLSNDTFDDYDNHAIAACIDELNEQGGKDYSECPVALEYLLVTGVCSDVLWASSPIYGGPYPDPYGTTATSAPSMTANGAAPSSPAPSARPSATSATSGASAASSAAPTVSASVPNPPDETCSSASPISNNAVARNEDGTGEVTQSNLCVPELGPIASVTLRYNMDSFFGELTRWAVFAYDADFTIAYSLWVAQVFTTSGQPVTVSGQPIYVGWTEGVWPDPGEGFGSDTTGSPSWSQVFGFYSGGSGFDSYVDSETAKTLYTNGFTLDRLRMIEVNDSPVLY